MKLVLAVLALALFAPAALAQAPSSAAPGSAAPAVARVAIAPIPLALPLFPVKAKLTVTSPAFKEGQPIPLANSAYGENKFPGLAWTGAPKGTKSFAVIMQDSDPPAQFASIQTILHWQMFNVPAAVTKLHAGITAPPVGALDGANMRGASAFYSGPRTPPGPPHHYHLQVFALDTALPLGDGAKIADVTAAMKGHVLASGEIVGTYTGPAPAQ